MNAIRKPPSLSTAPLEHVARHAHLGLDVLPVTLVVLARPALDEIAMALGVRLDVHQPRDLHVLQLRFNGRERFVER